VRSGPTQKEIYMAPPQGSTQSIGIPQDAFRQMQRCHPGRVLQLKSNIKIAKGQMNQLIIFDY